jgi:hypothetical protein
MVPWRVVSLLQVVQELPAAWARSTSRPTDTRPDQGSAASAAASASAAMESMRSIGFLAAGVVLLTLFAFWQGQAAHPLLPPRVLDRHRGGAYTAMPVGAAGMFGTFLFLTYYLQQTLGYSPVVTGFAFLPIAGGIAVAANLSTIAAMPRIGSKPLVADRPGPGPRLRHGVLVDRRHLGWRRGHLPEPASPRAADPRRHACGAGQRAAGSRSRGRPRRLSPSGATAVPRPTPGARWLAARRCSGGQGFPAK